MNSVEILVNDLNKDNTHMKENRIKTFRGICEQTKVKSDLSYRLVIALITKRVVGKAIRSVTINGCFSIHISLSELTKV